MHARCLDFIKALQLRPLQCLPCASATEGLPHVLEAQAAAEAAEAERAAAVRDIPEGAAGWEAIAAFMKQVEADMGSAALASWRADNNLRANTVDAMCKEWPKGKSVEQRKTIYQFQMKFKTSAFSSGDKSR